MAKIDWVDDRCVLWAEWVVRGRVDTPFTRSPLGDNWDAPKNREPRATIPLNHDDCKRTDEAICALPTELGRLVFEYYVNDSWVAMSRLRLSRSMLSVKLSHAHLRLASLLTEPAGAPRAPSTMPEGIVEQWARQK